MQPQDRPGRRRLAAARLADERQRGARFDLERRARSTACTAPDRALDQQPRPDREVLDEIGDGDDRRHAGVCLARRGRRDLLRCGARLGDRAGMDARVPVVGARHERQELGDLVAAGVGGERAARVERAARRHPRQARRLAGDRLQLGRPGLVHAGQAGEQPVGVGVARRRRRSRRTRPVSTIRPAYITAIRSAWLATRPRSCVISTIAVLRRSCSSTSSCMICACTVTSSAVVGSSASSTFGSLASAIAIMARCRMPPENSCGYCRARAFGFGIPTSASRSMALLVGRRLAHLLVHAHHLGDLVAHPEHRVQRRQRVLEDHRDVVAAQLALLRLRHVEQRPALQQHLPAGERRRRARHEAEDRHRRDGLARARLADDGQRLALVDVPAHAVDRLDDPGRGVEVHAQVAHLQHALGGGHAGVGEDVLVRFRQIRHVSAPHAASGRARRAARRRRRRRPAS